MDGNPRFLARSLGLLLFFISLSSVAAPLQTDKTEERIGDTEITLVQYQAKNAPWIYYHPHGDEPTSLKVAKKIILEYGGEIINIEQGNRKIRVVRFNLNGHSYAFDPNRMFSALGITLSLKNYGTYSKNAQQAVQKFAALILTRLSPYPLIIALHNNLQEGFSIQYYKPGGLYAHDVKKIYQNPTQSTHTLVVVTDPRWFNFFKDKHINVILQNNETVSDDGSLSYYCGKHHIPYINIETQRGNSKDQYNILKTLSSELIQH